MATTGAATPLIQTTDFLARSVYLNSGGIGLAQNESHTETINLDGVTAAQFWVSTVSIRDTTGTLAADLIAMTDPSCVVQIFKDTTSIWQQAIRLYESSVDLLIAYASDVAILPVVHGTPKILSLKVIFPALGSAAMPTFTFTIKVKLEIIRFN